jgi:multicomponent Na+:H+ antiporter subunit E
MMHAALTRATLFALLWWLLSEGRIDSWMIGVPAILLALIASLALLPPTVRRLSIRGLFGFAGFFMYQSIRAGTQVATLALRPRLDLLPGQVRVPVRLPPGPARILLVDVLNLLPGTVTVALAEGAEDELLLHVLDTRQPVVAAVQATEARIAALWKNVA